MAVWRGERPGENNGSSGSNSREKNAPGHLQDLVFNFKRPLVRSVSANENTEEQASFPLAETQPQICNISPTVRTTEGFRGRLLKASAAACLAVHCHACRGSLSLLHGERAPLPFFGHYLRVGVWSGPVDYK